MMPRETDHMLQFAYEKTADEIKEKAKAKIVSLNVKIEERQRRITELRDEHEIDDAALVALLTQARRSDRQSRYSYTSNAKMSGGTNRGPEEKTIGAGVVNHLLTENDFLESDKASVKRLEMIVRNLRPLRRVSDNGVKYEESDFSLSVEALEFLGF